MNLLFCGFVEKTYDEIINAIVKKYEAETTVIISPINYENIPSKKIVKYNFKDFELSIHKSISFPDLRPIDANILNNLLFCESTYLNLLDRLEIKLGKKISYEKRKECYLNDVRIQNHILEVNNIDLCILDYIPHLGFDYVLYELCKLKKIRVIMQCNGLPIPYKTVSRFFINDIYNPLPLLGQKYLKLLEELDACGSDIPLSYRMAEYINYYKRDKDEIISFVSMNSFLKTPPKFIKYIQSTVRMLINKDDRLIPAIKLRVKEVFRLKKIDKYLSTVECSPQAGDKYLYFPLHYQPECTSSPMASFYSNQLIVIQLISALLPSDMMLYVKPHPNASLLADKEYYEKITRFPNVAILPNTKNTYDLIDKSQGVVTLTGTAGWEAIVRGKPVLMFGYYFYQYAPGVYHIKTKEDCKNAIDDIYNNLFNFNLKNLKVFLQVLDEYLVEGYIDRDYESVYEIPDELNINNTIQGYINFIESKENW